MSLIEIGPVVIEVQGVENGELVVPVNNILVCHMAFLGTDTRLCVLIKISQKVHNYVRYVQYDI